MSLYQDLPEQLSISKFDFQGWEVLGTPAPSFVGPEMNNPAAYERFSAPIFLAEPRRARAFKKPWTSRLASGIRAMVATTTEEGPFAINSDGSAKDPVAFQNALREDKEKMKALEAEAEVYKVVTSGDSESFQQLLKTAYAVSDNLISRPILRVDRHPPVRQQCEIIRVAKKLSLKPVIRIPVQAPRNESENQLGSTDDSCMMVIQNLVFMRSWPLEHKPRLALQYAIP